MTGYLLQTFAALAAVVALMAGLSYFLKKRRGAPSPMKVVAYQSLGPRKGVAALRVGGEILLLGVTQSECRLLKAYPEEEFTGGDGAGVAERISRLKRLKGEMNG
ncbi:MAG: hypothetical protein Kow0025_04530 [Thermodesulfovibrionales bacterium]